MRGVVLAVVVLVVMCEVGADTAHAPRADPHFYSENGSVAKEGDSSVYEKRIVSPGTPRATTAAGPGGDGTEARYVREEAAEEMEEEEEEDYEDEIQHPIVLACYGCILAGCLHAALSAVSQ